jgi:uncharacterized protein (UPF0264 family)
VAGCPGLLVSVRSVAEAAAALDGGADVIDVKEPSRGSLGRADDKTIEAVVRFVDRRRLVSAALGELMEGGTLPRAVGLDFTKWGLAGCRHECAWRSRLAARLDGHGPSRPVIVAYADWEQADAPPLDEVMEFARDRTDGAVLVDTFSKDTRPGASPPCLLSWLPAARVAELCRSLHEAGVRVALAGSLDAEGITALRCAAPDWFAVRGAACAAGHRQGTVTAHRVRALVNLLREPDSWRTCADLPAAHEVRARSCP